jgi:hypothetical protein
MNPKLTITQLRDISDRARAIYLQGAVDKYDKSGVLIEGDLYTTQVWVMAVMSSIEGLGLSPLASTSCQPSAQSRPEGQGV